MKKTLNYSSGKVVFALAVLCAFLWGSAYPCVKLSYRLFEIASDDIPSIILLAGIRFTLAGALVLAACLTKGKGLKVPRRQWTSIGFLAFFQTFIQYSLYYVGFMHTEAAKGSIINQSSNFLLVLAAGLFFREDTLSIRKITGIAMGFLGVAVVNLNSASGGFTLLGEGLLLFSALSATAGYLISKKTGGQISPMLLTGWQQFWGGLALTILAILLGGNIAAPSFGSLLLLLYMALAVAIAYVIWTKLLALNEVAKVSAYKFLVPIFSTVCSAVILGEQVWKIQQVFSLLLVTAGILVINLPIDKWLKQRKLQKLSS